MSKFKHPNHTNIEDKKILEVAKQINIKHFIILEKAKSIQNRLLGLAKIEENDTKYKNQIDHYQNILDVLGFEQLAGQHNPYSVLANQERLYYLNKDILAKIQDIRKLDLYADTKQKLIDAELAVLDNKLKSDSEAMIHELLDTKNREQAYHKIIMERYSAKKLQLVRESMDGDSYHIRLTTSLGETIAGITRTILILTRQVGYLSQAMPFIGAACALITTIAMLITLDFKNLEGHKLFNTLVTISAGLFSIVEYGSVIIKDFTPTLAGKVGWIPILGTAVTWILLGVEIFNLIYLELRYKRELKALNNLFNDQKNLSDMDWLFDNNVKNHTKEQKKIKRIFERHVSTENLSDYDKKLILHLFKNGQFEKILLPELLDHIKRERYKRLWRHAINVAIFAVFAVAGVVSIIFPVAAPIIPIALVGFIIISTITKITLFKTKLKEKHISLEGLIPKECALACKLQEQRELAYGLGATKDKERAANSTFGTPHVAVRLYGLLKYTIPDRIKSFGAGDAMTSFRRPGITGGE